MGLYSLIISFIYTINAKYAESNAFIFLQKNPFISPKKLLFIKFIKKVSTFTNECNIALVINTINTKF